MSALLILAALCAVPAGAAEAPKDPAAAKLEAEADDYINGWLKPGGRPQDHEKAAEIYTELIKRYPRAGRYYARRAFCRVKRDKYPEALEDLNKAIELEPKNAEFYGEPWGRAAVWCRALGLNARKFCKPEARGKATTDLQAAARLDPGNWSRHNDLAESYRVQGRCD